MADDKFKTEKIAFGQRIGIKTDLESVDVLSDALAAVTTVTGDTPLAIIQKLFPAKPDAGASAFYDPSSQWMAGAHLELGLLTFEFLLQDSSFYGAKIAIGEAKKDDREKPGKKDGDKGQTAPSPAKTDDKDKKKKKKKDKNPFGGLVFEIVYREVKPGLGVFSANLTLPTKYRIIKMGEEPEVTIITLPTVGVEVWTNGDFKIVVGWPLGDNSFSIDFPPDPIPWSGGGGFYFAKLRSEDNPEKYGNYFSLIVEFGFGLKIGAATEGNKGILAYAASLYLEGSLQGMLGWQDGGGLDKGLDYYWFCGSLGITGSLSGSVDFKIISVSVSLTLSATAYIAFETRHKILLKAVFSVTATASIHIVFVTIHFSFHVSLTISTTLGPGKYPALTSGPTPKKADPPPPELTSQTAMPMAHEPQPAAMAMAMAPDRYANVEDAVYSDDQPVARPAAMAAPAMAPMADIEPPATAMAEMAPPVAAMAEMAPPAAAMAFEAAATILLHFVLQPTVVINGGTGTATAIASLIIERAPQGDKGGDAKDYFAQLVKGLITTLWNEHPATAKPNEPVTAAHLDTLADYLNTGTHDFKDWLAGLSFEIISHDPPSPPKPGETPPAPPPPMNGALFPIFPSLSYSYAGKTVPFAGTKALPPGYVGKLQKLFGDLGFSPDKGTGDTGNETSVAQILFDDYFMLIATQVVHDLQTALEDAKEAFEQSLEPGDKTKWTPPTLATMLSDIDYGNIAGLVSRFMQHGMRLPDPSKPNATAAMYALSNQQIALKEGQDVVEISGSGGDFNVTYDKNGKSTADVPVRVTVAPEWSADRQPKMLPSQHEVPDGYLLPQGWKWTRADTKPYSIARFPEPLLTFLHDKPDTTVNLFRISGDATHTVSDHATQDPAPGTNALVIPIELSTLTAGGSILPNTFGVACSANETTQEHLDALFDAKITDNVTVDILVSDGANGGWSTAKGSAVARLLKTDLSTYVEAMGMTAMAAPADGDTAPPLPDIGPTTATPAEALGFLRLIWEASVVHGGGYFLEITDIGDLFDGKTKLNAIVLVQSKDAKSATPKLAKWNNAITFEGQSDNRVHCQPLQSDGKPVMIWKPSCPPGCFAFGTTWSDVNAHANAGQSPQELADFLYHMMQYQVTGGDGVTKSDWGRPFGPASEDKNGKVVWTYREVVPVFKRLGAPAPAAPETPWPVLPAGPNPYDAIGKQATIGLQLLDSFGNDYHPAQGMSPVTGTPEYNDGVVQPNQWSGTHLSYEIKPGTAGKSAQLALNLHFDSAQALGLGSTGGAQTAPSNLPEKAKTAWKVYAATYQQYMDPNMKAEVFSSVAQGAVPVSNANASNVLDALRKFLADILKLLSQVVNGETPAQGPTIDADVTGSVPTADIAKVSTDLFEITASILIGRKTLLDDAHFTPAGLKSFFKGNADVMNPDVFAVQQPVGPHLDPSATNPVARLHTFALEFEQAYADYTPSGASNLKVMVGRNASHSKADQRNPGDLWALRWGPKNGVDVSFGNASGGAEVPIYYAPLPLSTELLSGKVQITEYHTSTGKPEQPFEKLFSRIDMDGWAKDFLTDLHSALSPDLAPAIAAADAAAYERIMQSKKMIASAIKDRLSYIVEDQKTVAEKAANLTSAQDRFEQALLKSLMADYGTSAIVQAPATVSIFGDLEAASGSGQPQAATLLGDVRAVPPAAAAKAGDQPVKAKQYTISSATLPLKDAKVGETSPLSFLVSATHPTEKTDIKLPLEYDIGFLDHDFLTKDAYEGYVPSSWLRFALPVLRGTSNPRSPGAQFGNLLQRPMGEFDVPIVLRSFPQPPQLVSHSASQVTPSAGEVPSDQIQDALKWHYNVSVATPTVAQDQMNLVISFNVPLVIDAKGSVSKPNLGANHTLFEALANFKTAYPQIAPKLKKIGTNPHAAQWLGNLADLTQRVAQGWTQWNEHKSLNAVPAPEGWAYSFEIDDETSGTVMAATRSQGAPWPEIDGWSTPTGDKLKGTYKTVSGKHAGATLNLVFPGQMVTSHQSAQTTAWIERNAHLGEIGIINPDFVYRTEKVHFPMPLVPLIEYDGAIKFQTKSFPDNFGAALADLFGSFSDHAKHEDKLILGVQIGFAYPLVSHGASAADTIFAKLPIFFTTQTIAEDRSAPDAITLAKFESDIEKAILDWTKTKHPNLAGAHYTFGVTVFSTIAANPFPLARVTDIEIVL